MALPAVPVRRPCIESSAKMAILFLRSAGEISAVVAARGPGASVMVVVEPPQAAARRRIELTTSLVPRMKDRRVGGGVKIFLYYPAGHRFVSADQKHRRRPGARPGDPDGLNHVPDRPPARVPKLIFRQWLAPK